LSSRRYVSSGLYVQLIFTEVSMKNQALCYAHARTAHYGEILQSTKCIFFFGTPHQGSDAAVWATLLTKLTAALCVRSSNVINRLETWSLPLVNLTTRFSQLAPNFAITAFFETADMHGVRVVPE
jgi:hypothetical protein